MGLLDNHPYTAVTAITNRIIDNSSTSNDDGLIETELAELFEAIRLQKNVYEPGPTEAARAVRKRLKHGTFNQQFNALKLMELLIANGGSSMDKFCNDTKMLNFFKYTLQAPVSESHIDQRIRQRMVQMTIGWRNEYSNDNQKKSLATLYKHAGLGKKSSGRHRSHRTVPDFMNDEADESTPFEEVYDDPRARQYDDSDSSSSSSYAESNSSRFSSSKASSSSKHHSGHRSRLPFKNGSQKMTNSELDKKYKIPKINYEKETPKIYQIIAQCNILSTNLTNTLTSLEPDELSIHSVKANEEFDKCRSTRRKILRYLQLVQKEELLGALLKCNDDLVTALQLYEKYSVSRDGNAASDESDEDSLANYETDHDDSSTLDYDTYNRDSDEEIESHPVIKQPVPVANRPMSPPPRNPNASMLNGKKSPPPIPPKSPQLRNAIRVNIPSMMNAKPLAKKEEKEKEDEDDDDPFEDTNEVSNPTIWR